MGAPRLPPTPAGVGGRGQTREEQGHPHPHGRLPADEIPRGTGPGGAARRGTRAAPRNGDPRLRQAGPQHRHVRQPRDRQDTHRHWTRHQGLHRGVLRLLHLRPAPAHPHPGGKDRKNAQKHGNPVRALRPGHLRRARVCRLRQGERRDALQPPLPQDRQEGHRHHHQLPLHPMGRGAQGQGALLRAR